MIHNPYQNKSSFRAYLLTWSPAIALTGLTIAIIGFICFCITGIIGDSNYSMFWISFAGMIISLVFANVTYFGWKINKQLNRYQKAHAAFIMRLLFGFMLLCYSLAADKLLLTILLGIGYFPMTVVYWAVTSEPGSPPSGSNPWN